jgi:hypothetical protein
MFRKDAIEAAPIALDTVNAILGWAPLQGRPGADLRAACGYIIANVIRLLQNGLFGPPIVRCFDLTVTTGIDLKQLARIRGITEQATPKTAGAITIKDSLIELCLATEGRVIANTDFKSRADAEDCKLRMNEAFNAIEEHVADQMDAMTYRALIALHAAITFHLIETARPLPRMLYFKFNQPMSTLHTSMRLYYEGGRADELRVENKVVHPAFMRPYGRALSS